MKELKPKAISLFSGAGGCSLGFKRAGYQLVYATDIDAKAIASYRANFPNTFSEVENIDEVDFDLVLSRLGLKPGEVDIVIGGPPCQGFSTAGTRFWDDPRNHLLRSYLRALKIIKPKWFLMENVEGLLTSHNGIYVSEAIKAFVDLGYRLRIEKVYAQEFGIPQRRKRVIIVGNRLGKDFDYPDPIAPVAGRIFRNSAVNLMHAITDLPSPVQEAGDGLSYVTPPEHEVAIKLRDGVSRVYDHEYSEPLGLNRKRIEALGPGQTMKDLPTWLQHQSFKRRANRRVCDGTPSEKRGGSPSGLKRLVPSEPSLTITSAATREFVHPTQNRTLTVRECARLQTFPDSFRFFGTNSDKIKQIGNAIPPDLAFQFATHITEQLGFHRSNNSSGLLLDYNLTKASAMSPALKNTATLLQHILSSGKSMQTDLFEQPNAQ